MNTRPNLISICVLYSLTLAIPHAVHAAGISVYSAVTSSLAAECPEVAQDFITEIDSDKEVSDAFAASPFDKKGICGCTAERINNDVQLREYLNVDPSLARSRLKLPGLEKYTSLLMVKELYVCLSKAIDRNLQLIQLK